MSKKPSPVTVIDHQDCDEKMVQPARAKRDEIKANPNSTPEEISSAECDLEAAIKACNDIDTRDLKAENSVLSVRKKPCCAL